MNYIASVTKAITYIENRLMDKITADEIAKWAGYSPYHFHRVFQSVTRCTVSDYIRRRRLTHAAYDLFDSDLRIVEIAIKYQFESQEAFTRAFQKMFSISPGRFRKQINMKDTMFRMMEMKALDETGMRHLHDDVTLDPLMVNKEKLHLVGMEIKGLNSREIGKLWNGFRQRAAEVTRRRDPESAFYALITLTGVEWEVSYTACVEVTEEGQIPEGMVYKVLPQIHTSYSRIGARWIGYRIRSITSITHGYRNREEYARMTPNLYVTIINIWVPRMMIRNLIFISPLVRKRDWSKVRERKYSG
ncbi:AraC family transcriptional regulator [Paenibacillus sedimenti]|uniref:AraC family transcriptional regulator n=1 Tax=Paenibacillus sedimenti TaxID=2770274 RepID=UPI00406B9D30